MGWFSDFFTFENLAPIAAGALTGGLGYGLMAATAAGAGTGAGIAALRGDDIASGAIGGGLGGMSGGNIYSAFNPTGSAITASQTAATEAAKTGAKGVAALKPAFSQGYSLGGFKEGVQNLGGGSTLMGTGKLASMGVMGAGIGGIQNQQPMVTEDFMPEKYKYDPTRRLNLGDDVDSGLRLIAKGGYIGNNYATGGYLEGGGIPEAVSVTETDTMSMEPDGMSDSIAATIDQEQPAALSEGEFVIPADVVSFAGNGSSEAGAKRFYKMLGDIREASTGQREQIKEIDVEEYMPMGGGLGTIV